MERESQQYEKFGCCAFWNKCDNATACVHVSTAPNKMKACGLYRRHSSGEVVSSIEPLLEDSKIEETETLVTENVTSEDTEFTQLSLF